MPGIGSFTLDPGAVIPQESDRNGQAIATGISFREINIAEPDDALVTFIKEHTGKMKSLAAADLDFFLTTGKQLLNIGKPFYLEGIGTLLKNKEGRLDFTPGEYVVSRLEEPAHAQQERKTSAYDESSREHESGTANARQTLLLVAIVAGLILIGWGGYYFYKKNTFVEPSSATNATGATVIPDTPSTKTAPPVSVVPATDTSKTAVSVRPPDTTAHVATPTVPSAPVAAQPTVTPGAGESLYRYVILETDNKHHALRRYNQLLGYQLNIKMDQKDSAHFKLYFPISAAPKDTTHIKDSLADVYASPSVHIEQ